jgi:magnesium chelatase subunit D
VSGAPIPAAAPYPLSAIVGQDDLKLALLLHAVDPKLGGVLIRGEKGSGKSTAARALATLLPAAGPDGAPAPFVELPIGATEDRVVGTLDLEGALLEGRSRLRPGLLAAAHGGVLYVDEVNLLADHLVDVLIDAAAFGINRIERDGICAEHPSRFVLVGSMNPEEGELRPQLLDRFGLAVEVRAPRDPEQRTEVVRRRLAFDADPVAFAERFEAGDEALREAIAEAGRILGDVVVPDDVLAFTSRLCAELDAEGLRADLVLARGVAALAALDGRKEATADDVARLAPLALAHRRRRGPLDAPGLTSEELDDALERAAPPPAVSAAAPPDTDEAPPSSAGPADAPGVDGAPPDADKTAAANAGPTNASGSPPGRPASGGEGAETSAGAPGGPSGLRPAGPAPGVSLALKIQRPSGVLGRRNRGPTDRGGIVAARPAPDGVTDIAVAATVQAAATRRAAGAPGDTEAPPSGTKASGDGSSPARKVGTIPTLRGPEALVDRADLRQAVREARTANLVVLCVDASGSMGAAQRIEAAKGAAVSLLLDAYQRRDRVALVTFAGDGAQVALRPTGSVEVARARLAALPTGGRTPLAPGLRAALDVVRSARHRDPDRRPVIVVVTDGRATSVGPSAAGAAPGVDPLAAAMAAAADIAAAGIEALVVDAENGDLRLGLARQLAEAMGAHYAALPELRADLLTRAVEAVVQPE